MATYSILLRWINQVIGENPDTWGDIVDTGVFQVLEDAIAATANVTVSNADVTLTTVNGMTDQARCAALDINGGLGADVNVIVPNTSKLYVARNRTTGNYHITVKTASGSGVVVPQNEVKFLLVVAGTGVVEVGKLPNDFFFDTGLVPTQVSTTSFSITGDQTTRLFASQRLKLFDSAILYGTVVTSVFGSGVTTVTMLLDSGTLTGALHKIYAGLGHPNKPIHAAHVDKAMTLDTAQTVTGTKTLSGVPFNEAPETDITSAASIDLTTGPNYRRVTGTVDIDTIIVPDGAIRELLFTDVLAVKNGADLILPGGADIDVNDGDTLIVRGEAAGVRRAKFFPINTAPISDDVMRTILAGDLSLVADSVITFPAGDYEELEVDVIELEAASDYLAYLRLNGDTGNNYNYVIAFNRNGAGGNSAPGSAQSAIAVHTATQLLDDKNTTQNPVSFTIKLFNPKSTTKHKSVSINPFSARNNSSQFEMYNTTARWLSNAALASLTLLLRNTTGFSPAGSSVFSTSGRYVVRGRKR